MTKETPEYLFVEEVEWRLAGPWPHETYGIALAMPGLSLQDFVRWRLRSERCRSTEDWLRAYLYLLGLSMATIEGFLQEYARHSQEFLQDGRLAEKENS